jgi:hypothetical protein
MLLQKYYTMATSFLSLSNVFFIKTSKKLSLRTNVFSLFFHLCYRNKKDISRDSCASIKKKKSHLAANITLNYRKKVVPDCFEAHLNVPNNFFRFFTVFS